MTPETIALLATVGLCLVAIIGIIIAVVRQERNVADEHEETDQCQT